jgi:CheY-like chemotaxis protein
MSVTIVLVEDDPLDAMAIREGLEGTLGALVEVLTTESEFVESLPIIRANPPGLIIFDVMLRWAKPTYDLTEESIPPDVRDGGFYLAGIRCAERLMADSATRQIPFIIYSGLDSNNFTRYKVLTKSEDISPLLEEVRKALRKLDEPD